MSFSTGWARILLQGWELSITSGLNPGVLLWKAHLFHSSGEVNYTVLEPVHPMQDFLKPSQFICSHHRPQPGPRGGPMDANQILILLPSPPHTKKKHFYSKRMKNITGSEKPPSHKSFALSTLLSYRLSHWSVAATAERAAWQISY